jgi:Tol biopolymer transport system component
MIQSLSEGLVPDGPPLTVQGSGLDPHSPIWLDDGNKLLFADSMQIFEWNRKTGSSPIYAADGDLGGGSLALSASTGVGKTGSKQLAIAVEKHDPDVYSIPLDARGMRVAGQARVVQRSTSDDHHPDYSPDGRLITFISGRSGAAEVWVANADGSNPRQLTHLGAHVASYPKWSPDGTKIAFHARMPDVSEVYVVDVKEGEARQITHENPGLALATWSRDGKYIYASTLVGGKATNYRFPAEGGSVERMWEGALLKESVDGKYAIYWKSNQPGIFRRLLAGDPRKNPEELLIPDFWPTGQLGGYAPFADGIYYVSGNEQGEPGPFRFFNYATKKSVDIAPAVPGLGRGIAVSPDRRSMAFVATVNQGGDLYLLRLE